MHFGKFTRVAAALVCGAIVASSGSVVTFAATNDQVTSGHFCDPSGKHREYRGVTVVQPAHGKIKVQGVVGGAACCDDIITVTLIPDKGYAATKIGKAGQYITTNNDVDWQGITKVSENVYSFKMPWCDPKIGIKIEAKFVPAGQADVTPGKADVTPAPSQADAAPAQSGEDNKGVISDGKQIIPINVVSTAHGKIVVSCKSAKPEEVVTVKLIPDAGYTAKKMGNNFFKTNNDVDWQTFTKIAENTYSFKMPWADPAKGLAIEAEFVAK